MNSVAEKPDALKSKDLKAEIDKAQSAAETTKDPWKYAELGDLFTRAGRLAEAEAAYRTSVALPGGNYPRHRDALADVLERLGRIDEAIEVVERTLELDRNRENRHLQLGKLLIRAGNYQEARNVLHRGLWINPQSMDINNALKELRRLTDASDKKNFGITSAEWLFGGVIFIMLCGPGFLISAFPGLTVRQVMGDNWILFDLKARLVIGLLFLSFFSLGVVGVLKGLRGYVRPSSRLYKILFPR